MALGELTRLAQQAINAKDVLDSLRPSDLSSVADALRTSRPSAAAPGENVCATILGQVQAMQKALKEDEELVVLCAAGGETVRVLEFFLPSWQVAVLTGIDTARNVTRIVTPVEKLELV